MTCKASALRSLNSPPFTAPAHTCLKLTGLNASFQCWREVGRCGWQFKWSFWVSCGRPRRWTNVLLFWCWCSRTWLEPGSAALWQTWSNRWRETGYFSTWTTSCGSDAPFIFWSKLMLCSITAFKVLTCELFKPMSNVAPAHFSFWFLKPSKVHVVSLGCLLCPCLKAIGRVFFIARLHACLVFCSDILRPPCCCSD